MQGLKSITSWRTFLTGVIVGYIFAWGIHWACQLYGIDGRLYDESVPFLTFKFGRNEKAISE